MADKKSKPEVKIKDLKPAKEVKGGRKHPRSTN